MASRACPGGDVPSARESPRVGAGRSVHETNIAYLPSGIYEGLCVSESERWLFRRCFFVVLFLYFAYGASAESTGKDIAAI